MSSHSTPSESSVSVCDIVAPGASGPENVDSVAVTSSLVAGQPPPVGPATSLPPTPSHHVTAPTIGTPGAVSVRLVARAGSREIVDGSAEVTHTPSGSTSPVWETKPRVAAAAMSEAGERPSPIVGVEPSGSSAGSDVNDAGSAESPLYGNTSTI